MATTPTPQQLRDALKQIKYPGFSRDIVAFGVVKDIAVGGAAVTVELAPSTGNAEVVETIRRSVSETLTPLVDLPVEIVIERPAAPTPAPAADKPAIPGVRHVVAVASGKGGVGKSTVSVNLAAALARTGQRVGVLDADVYGPSVPLMLGMTDKPKSTEDKRLIPVTRYDLRVMSMGFLVPDGHAVIWRGPMIDKLLTEFITKVEWGELDVLVVDLPPGTGDAQLTVVQKVPLSGGVIVTTPQDVALLDVRRGIKMFEEVAAPVLGVVENMSSHVCRACGHESHVFSRDGGARMAEEFGLPLLGRLPLVRDIMAGGDAGAPIVVTQPDHAQSRTFADIARAVVLRLEAGQAQSAALQ